MVKLLLSLFSTMMAATIPIQFIFSSDTDNMDYFVLNMDTITNLAEQSISGADMFKCEHIIINSPDEVQPSIIQRGTVFAIDMTQNPQIGMRLQALAQEINFVHIVMDSNEVSGAYGWSFPGLVHPDLIAKKTQLLNALIVQELEWISLSVSTSKNGIKFKSHFEYLANLIEVYFPVSLYLSNSQQNIVNQVGRMIKPQGLNLAVVYSDGPEIEWMLRAFEAKRISGRGYAFLIVGEGFTYINRLPDDGYGILYTGAWYLIEKGLETAKSDTDIRELRIVKMLERVYTSYISCGILSSSSETISPNCLLFQFSSQNFNDFRQLQEDFYLFNAQSGKLVTIGSVTDKAVMYPDSTIIYPGGTSDVPFYVKPSIPFVYLGGHLNNPLPFDGLAYGTHLGGQAAFEEIQSRSDILPKHDFKMNLVEIGGSILNTEATGIFIEKANELGYAYIGAFTTVFAEDFHLLEEKYEIYKPKVWSQTIWIQHNDPNVYPYFSRVSIQAQNYAVAISALTRIFDWRKFILIVNDYPELYEVKDILISVFGQNIEIVHEFYLPISIDLNSFYEDYEEMIDTIIDSDVRIIISLSYELNLTYKIYESFYRKGLRAPDIIPIFEGILDITSVRQNYPEYFDGTIEFFHGGMTVQQILWDGEIGQNLIEFSKNVTGPEQSPFDAMWLEYDSMYALAYAFNAALPRGVDYELAADLHEEIRNQRFSGWSGSVVFEQETNDRSFPGMELFQTEYKNDLMNIVKFGEYNPLSSNVLVYNSTFFWADGRDSIPSDIRSSDWSCPFKDADIEYSSYGIAITFAICYFILLLAIITIALIWKRFWQLKVIEISIRKEFSQSDMMLCFGMLITFLQYINMGSSFDTFAFGLYVISSMFAADIEVLIDLTDGLFWIVVDIWIVLSAIMIIFYLLEMTNFLFKFYKQGFESGIRVIINFLLQIIGDILFLPIIQIFLDVFVWIQHHGDEISDLFLYKDWYASWWIGDHLIHAVLGGIWLVFYVPLAVYMRPKWQECQHDLNVIASPAFLMVKSILQIAIVSLNKTIGRIYPIPFASIYLTIFIGYASFILKRKPYNYNRFCLWEFLLTLGVLWVTFISILHNFMSSSATNAYFGIFLYWGWLILIIVGLIIQYKHRNKQYQSMLYFPSTEKYNHMIRFQFFSGAVSDLVAARLTKKHVTHQQWRQRLAKWRQSVMPMSQELRYRQSTILVDKPKAVANLNTIHQFQFETEEFDVRAPESSITDYTDDG